MRPTIALLTGSLLALGAGGCGDMLEVDQECPARGITSGCDDAPRASDELPRLVCGADPTEDTLICLESCATSEDCPSHKECTPVEGTAYLGCTNKVASAG